MRDQTERMRAMEDLIATEFFAAWKYNRITEAEYVKYMAELKALTDFIYEQQKGQLLFTKEGWHKINDYYQYICSLDFVKDRTKEDLELVWLIER